MTVVNLDTVGPAEPAGQAGHRPGAGRGRPGTAGDGAPRRTGRPWVRPNSWSPTSSPRPTPHRWLNGSAARSRPPTGHHREHRCGVDSFARWQTGRRSPSSRIARATAAMPPRASPRRKPDRMSHRRGGCEISSSLLDGGIFRCPGDRADYCCGGGHRPPARPDEFVALRDVDPRSCTTCVTPSHNFVGEPVNGYLAATCILTRPPPRHSPAPNGTSPIRVTPSRCTTATVHNGPSTNSSPGQPISPISG